MAGYSQAVKAGGFVFVAGQGPFDPVTGEVVGETIGPRSHIGPIAGRISTQLEDRLDRGGDFYLWGLVGTLADLPAC